MFWTLNCFLGWIFMSPSPYPTFLQNILFFRRCSQDDLLIFSPPSWYCTNAEKNLKQRQTTGGLKSGWYVLETSSQSVCYCHPDRTLQDWFLLLCKRFTPFYPVWCLWHGREGLIGLKGWLRREPQSCLGRSLATGSRQPMLQLIENTTCLEQPSNHLFARQALFGPRGLDVLIFFACLLMPSTIPHAWSLWANASSDRSRNGQLTDSSGVLQLLLLYSEQQKS